MASYFLIAVFSALCAATAHAAINGTCPEKCFPVVKAGFRSAFQGCKEANAGIAKNERPCKIKKCFIANSDGSVERGFKCTCTACPDVCKIGQAGLEKVQSECADLTASGTCLTLPCVRRNGKFGAACTGSDFFAECPSVCRPGVTGITLATLECDLSPTCKSSMQPCEVVRCQMPNSAETGTMCGCGASICPNTCYFDEKAEERADFDCSSPRLCFDGSCSTRTCAEFSRVGKGCRCADAMSCPNDCQVGPEAFRFASEQCSGNVVCPDSQAACIVKKCTRDSGESGFACSCADRR